MSNSGCGLSRSTSAPVIVSTASSPKATSRTQRSTHGLSSSCITHSREAAATTAGRRRGGRRVRWKARRGGEGRASADRFQRPVNRHSATGPAHPMRTPSRRAFPRRRARCSPSARFLAAMARAMDEVRVRPSEVESGRIVAKRTSWPRNRATTAWPASWCATAGRDQLFRALSRACVAGLQRISSFTMREHSNDLNCMK